MINLTRHIPVWLLAASCLSCGARQPADTRDEPDPACPHPQKIPVYKENVYDLDGYADEGLGDPFRLFDENDRVDPGNRPDDPYKPATNPQPTRGPWIYFPPGKGNRIVVDLQKTWQLTHAYLFDRSNHSDSVWIYTGDMLHWKLKAAFRTTALFQSSGWRKFTLNDASRYVMIRFNSPDIAITEMVLYGCSNDAEPAPRAQRAEPESPFDRKPMKEFLGVNDYSGAIDPKWLKPFFYTRLYSFAVDFDRDTIHRYPDIQYNMTHFGYWDPARKDYDYQWEDNVKQNHHEVWYSMQKLPLWMTTGGRDKGARPVTTLGMDPEDPRSYGRHGSMMWTLAAFFGRKRWDTTQLSLDHEPKSSGRGTMHLYENGNEDDATWIGDKYCNPMAYFAQSNADYDGVEGALGNRCGIRNADTGSALITSGMIEMDTNRVKTYKFLCSTLRKDGAFIWNGGIQYHHYSTNGTHGITPEEDSMRWKLAKVSRATHRLVPNVPCILGENGYDKSQQTRQSTPVLPGYSNEESQAVFILRSINATAFSGFDSYILYWLRDSNPSDDKNVYLTCGVVREMPDGSIRPYPSWFYVSAFERRLGDYRPDRIVSEQGGAWIYKYRNTVAPDSVAYFVYAPTHNGITQPNFSLNLGATAGPEAAEIDFTPDSPLGLFTPRKIVNGTVTITVEEKPKLILAKEQGRH